MTEKKGHVLSTRVDDRTLEYIDNYSQNYDISYSYLIRKALNYYVKYANKEDHNSSYTKPSLIISKEYFKYMMDHLNEDDMKNLANITHNNLLYSIKKYFAVVNKEEVEPFDINVRLYIGIVNTNMFQIEGNNWFNNFRHVFNRNMLSLGGDHSINLNFSIFIKYLFIKVLNSYSYELVEEKIEENKIFLRFEIPK